MVERASGGGRRNGAGWTPARARTLHVAGGRPTLSHSVSGMMIVGALQATARWLARALGRESFVVRSVRPAYETLLEYVSRGRGVQWTINGVTFHVDPRHRHQVSPNYDAPAAPFLAKRVRPGNACINILVEMHPDSWALTGHARSLA